MAEQIILKTFKYRIYPSKAQNTCLNNTLALCCELYNASDEVQKARLGLGKPLTRGLIQGHSRLTAYAAKHKGDPILAQRAWSEFRREPTAVERSGRVAVRTVAKTDVLRLLATGK